MFGVDKPRISIRISLDSNLLSEEPETNSSTANLGALASLSWIKHKEVNKQITPYFNVQYLRWRVLVGLINITDQRIPSNFKSPDERYKGLAILHNDITL